MGYMGLKSINDSDLAADLTAKVLKEVAKELKKGLKEKGNSLNTEGCVNVSLFFEQCFCCSNDPCIYLDENLKAIATETKGKIDKLIFETIKEKDEWEESSNYQYHVSAYRRMVNNLKKFLEKSED